LALFGLISGFFAYAPRANDVLKRQESAEEGRGVGNKPVLSEETRHETSGGFRTYKLNSVTEFHQSPGAKCVGALFLTVISMS